MLKIFSIFFWVVAVGQISCTTTKPVSRVDKSRNQVIVYSSGDTRSTMTLKTEDSHYADVIDDLEEKNKSKYDENSTLNLANVYLIEGKLDQAERLTRQVLRKNLKSKNANKLMAQVFLKRGQVDLANIILSNLGGENSRDSEIINMVAQVNLAKDNKDEAVRLLRKAIKVNSKDVAARMNLGVLLLAYRQVDGASIQFERVLKLIPDHSDAKLHLAIIRGIRGDHRRAGEVYDEILDKHKNNELALYNSAVTSEKQAKYSDAVAKLEKFLRVEEANPDDVESVLVMLDTIQSKQRANGKIVDNSEIRRLAEELKTKKSSAAPKPIARVTDEKTVAKDPQPKKPTVEANKPLEQPKNKEKVEEKDELEREIDQLEALLK